MIIAVNARTLKAEPGDGIGWFTLEVVSRMIADHPGHRFILIGDRKLKKQPVDAPNITYITVSPRAVHPFLWYVWHEWLLPGVLKRIKADILVAPDGIIPLRGRTRSIPVIHDLNHEHRPDDFPWSQRIYYRYFFPRIARRADRIATVSEFSAGDICSTYGIDRECIDVVPNGVADIFSPPAGKEAEETRKRYTGGKPYFLFVSNFSPRKNIVTTIKAWELFRSSGAGDHLLLLAGKRLYLTGDVERAVSQSPYSGDILFTGSVGRDELRKLYGAGEALLFVSWFEGFGIPVIEAQRCGMPCIVSEGSSLPEVSGGAALCAGPAGAGAIAAAMARVVSDNALRRQLSTQGIANSLRYTWENAAKAMWNSIIKTTADGQHA